MITDNQPGEQEVAQFIVHAAYGEVMHQFQVFELTLWGFATRSIKDGTSLDQAMQKVEKWDTTTLGNVVRGLKSQTHWPAGLTDELDNAVKARNYLAHDFLREYFLATPNNKIKDQAVEQLANVSVRLTDLQNMLETPLLSLRVPSFVDLDDETRTDLQELRSTEWLDN